MRGTRQKEGMIEMGGKGALRRKVDDEEHLKIYGGSREVTGVETYLHGPVGSAITEKLRFRVGNLRSAIKKKEIHH